MYTYMYSQCKEIEFLLIDSAIKELDEIWRKKKSFSWSIWLNSGLRDYLNACMIEQVPAFIPTKSMQYSPKFAYPSRNSGSSFIGFNGKIFQIPFYVFDWQNL